MAQPAEPSVQHVGQHARAEAGDTVVLTRRPPLLVAACRLTGHANGAKCGSRNCVVLDRPLSVARARCPKHAVQRDADRGFLGMVRMYSRLHGLNCANRKQGRSKCANNSYISNHNVIVLFGITMCRMPKTALIAGGSACRTVRPTRRPAGPRRGW